MNMNMTMNMMIMQITEQIHQFESRPDEYPFYNADVHRPVLLVLTKVT